MTHIKKINEYNEILPNIVKDDNFKIHITSVDIYDNRRKTSIKEGDFLDWKTFKEKISWFGIDSYTVEIDKKDKNTYVVVYIDNDGDVSCEIAFTIVYFDQYAAGTISDYLIYGM